MMHRWTFAQRVGAGLSACVFAGLVLLFTLLFSLTSLVAGPHARAWEDSTVLGILFVTGLLGLAGVASVAMLLGRALAPLHRRYQQSERRLRLLMEDLRDYALCFLDREGRVVGWSAGAERITGHSRADVAGRSADRLYPEEAVADGLPRLHRERAAREGRLLAEGWRVRRDGSRFFAETLLTALRDERGGLQGFAEVTRDITERRRVERAQALFAEAGRVLTPAAGQEALREALPRLCVPAVADACVLFLPDEDGTVRPRAAASVGLDDERHLWELLLRRPETDEHGPARVARTGRAELLPEVDLERLPRELREGGHGELLRVLGARSCLCVPLTVGPRVLGALWLVSTQPHRRYSGVDLAFMEELAGRAALALDNARLLAEAQGALELIGVAAHDLSNPLWSLQLRLRKLRKAGTPEAVGEGLGLAEREVLRLGGLVRNLLDLSSLSADTPPSLQAEEVDLGALVREVVERHADQAQAAGCALTLRAEPGVAGQWDKLRLDRVATNLLTNALKYGHGQPVEVSVQAAPGAVRLVVRDHGMGIAPEVQGRLFGRFARVHQGQAHEGVGLGLYITRQLVEAHGGTIRVQSQPGQGAEFTVELPRAHPLPPQAGAAPA